MDYDKYGYTYSKNLKDQRFGSLVVLDLDHVEGSEKYWKCKCDCGNTVIKTSRSLLYSKNPDAISCGCKLKELHSMNAKKLNQRTINPNFNKFSESDEELIGKKFGKLTIVRFDHMHITPNGKRKRYFLCKCDCGNEKVISYYSLKFGNTTSCGSCGYKTNLKDKKFGRLTVKEFAGKASDGAALWKCKCDCGNEIVVRSRSLITGNTKSCGCLSMESRHAQAKYTNRYAYKKLHTMYWHIVDRRRNPNNESYQLYKDIPLEWDNFEDFYNYSIDLYEEAVKRYGEDSDLEIDRINNSDGYAAGNIRFIPAKTNNLNKCTNLYFEYADQLWTTGMFANYLNSVKNLTGELSYTREDIQNRLKNGWTFDMLMHIPNKTYNKQFLYTQHPATSPIYDVNTVKELHKSSQYIHSDDIDYLYNNGDFNYNEPDAIKKIVEYNKEHYLFPHLRELGKGNK